MNPRRPFKRLVLRAVLRHVSPMVIRVLAVPDYLDLLSFNEVFRSIPGCLSPSRTGVQQLWPSNQVQPTAGISVATSGIVPLHLRCNRPFGNGSCGFWMRKTERPAAIKVPICLAGGGEAPPFRSI